MSVSSVKNQYLGANAHLHSHWQSAGGWSGFHTNHITDLMRLMRVALLPMGYTAEIEPSLQIRRLDAPIEEAESDITIFDLNPSRSFQSPPSVTDSSGVLVLPVPEALAEQKLSERQYSAIAIVPTKSSSGEPVAWIELLSPTNKGNSPDAETYREKRSKVVHGGLVFVEIDYLHESAATFSGVVDYRVRRGRPLAQDAHPYRIAVIDPHPEFDLGKAYIREFDVDAPIPTIEIPLSADDVLEFDFGAAYRKTFEETLYGMQLVDYSQLPERFDRYSPADQTRIAVRMVAVLEAARQGLDLETGTFPVKDMRLDDALKHIEMLNADLSS